MMDILKVVERVVQSVASKVVQTDEKKVGYWEAAKENTVDFLWGFSAADRKVELRENEKVAVTENLLGINLLAAVLANS